MNTGVVARVNVGRSCGFIKARGWRDTFFHKSDLDSTLPFDETLVGHRVAFEIVQGERGPKAVKVRAAD